jgi:hypothetical protein
MPAEPVLGYLRYRVVDNNTGNVVIPDLPHLHESSWTVYALQQGFPGSTSIGTFTIPLPPPLSDLYRANQSIYASLAREQRIEAFRGDVIDGSTAFSGIITKLPRTLTSYQIEGSDSLYLLQQSQMFPAEQILAPFAPHFLYTVFLATRECVWDDDFSGFGGGSGPHPSTDYTNSNWNFTSSDPFLGKPAVWASAANPTIAHLATNTTWGVNAQFAPCTITIHGTMVGGSDTSASSEAGILLLSDSTAANGVLVRALMRQTAPSSGLYNIDAQIFTINSGTYTLQAQVQNVFQNLGNTFNFEVGATIYQWGASRVIQCIINGQDTGCQYLTNVLPSSGGIGLRYSEASGQTGSPITYVNRLTFQSRTGNWGTNRFAQGTNTTGSMTVQNSVAASSQTHLDMLLLAASTDGFYLRKNAGFGYKADSMDYEASPGTDLSAEVIFEEGVNVTDAQVLPVADIFSTDAKVNAIPGGDSGGSFTWSKLANTGDLILTDTVADIGIPGYSLLTQYAKLVQARKVNPMQATQITVVRTADTADKWRELDTVLVHIPTLGIYRQASLIVGYTYTEGSAEQTIYLSQLPSGPGLAQAMRRITGPVEYLSNVLNPRS